MSAIKPRLKMILPCLVTALMAGCNGPSSSPQNNSNNAQAFRTPSANTNANRVAPAPVPTPVHAGGDIEVTSTPPGATVVMIREEEGSSGDPERKGSTPVMISGVAPGKYSINLEKPGFKPFQKEVEVKEAKTVKIAATLKRG